MSSSDRVLKNVSYNWVGLGVSLVLGFIQAPIVVLGLGNTWYGIWILVHQITAYGWLFDIGIREAVVRYVSKHHSQREFDTLNRILSSAIYLYVLISAITLVIILAFAILLPYFFKIPNDAVGVARMVLFLGGLNIAISWYFNTYIGILMGLKRFDIFQKIGISTGLLNFTLVITFIKFGYGIIALSLISISVNIISNTLIYWQCRKLLPEFKLLRFDWAKMQFKFLINYGKYILLNNIGYKIIDSSDTLLIAVFLSPAAITFYSIPKLLIIYMEKLVGVSTWVLSPVFSELESKNATNKIKSILSMGTKMSFLIGLPIGIVYFILGKRFISLWMGKEYGESGGLVLLILTVSSLSAIWHHVITSALYGISRHHIIAYSRVAEAAASIILSVVFLRIWGWGIEGVALGASISHVLVMFVVLPVIVCRNFDISMGKYVKESVVYPILASIPFAVCCYAVNRNYPAQSLLIFFVWVALLMPVFIFSAWFVSFSRREREEYAQTIFMHVPAIKILRRRKIS